MPMQKATFCLVLICCGASALAQKPVQAHPEAQSILLNVQVTDKAGHPITGLTQSDFTLLEDGKPAPIRMFAALPGSDPGTVSIVLVIDEVNVGIDQVTFVRQQIAKFLRSYGGHLPASVSIDLLTEKDVTQLAPPETDGNRLASELEQSEAHFRPVPVTADWGPEERWQESIVALDKLEHYQAAKPGHELLIWISPGWAIFNPGGMMITDSEQAMWMKWIVGFSTGLRDARITLDVVSPGFGLRADQWEGFVKPVKKQGDANLANLSLQVLATQSGGRVLYAQNDPAHDLAACAEDATAWYAIRFDGQTDNKPDTWHDIEVKVDRPGAVVRTNNGYYSQP
jgi:VWFA-related protein